MNSDTKYEKGSNRAAYACGVFALLIGIGVGIIIGYFGISKNDDREGLYLKDVPEALIREADDTIAEKLRMDIKGDNIKTHLRKIADKPRVAGTDNEKEKAQYVFDFWKNEGVNDVTMFPYNVMLSYANVTDPSKAYIVDGSTGNNVFESQGLEKIRTRWGNRTDLMPPILGYTPSGEVEGEIVYANYAFESDFLHLESLNISVKDRIVLARYGKLYRGDKVHFAQVRGAKGILLYDDPKDWNPSKDSDYYPHSAALPPDGVQRGSAFIGNGDPDTPGYPSTDFAYRYTDEDKKFPMPEIVGVPISYEDAMELLSAMSGDEVKEDWRGWLNVTYRYGPGLQAPNHKVRVRSTNYRRTREINNVCATIEGSVEKDRYVIIGAHLDSWVYGAVDNAQGVAIVLEVSRAFMKLVNKGDWRPRRSLVFCAWGGEEYGLLGSTEWVEQYERNLHQRTVALINLDCPIFGNSAPIMMGSPQLYKVIKQSLKQVQNPIVDERSDNKTVYDSLVYHSKLVGFPTILKPTGGTDYVSFVTRLGIPVMELHYRFTSRTQTFYSTYHTTYDTIDILEKFYDPTFKLSETVAMVDAELMRSLGDGLILPFDVTDYAQQLRIYFSVLNKTHGDLMRNHNVSLDPLDTAITQFATTCDGFMKRVGKVNKDNPIEVRSFNDQLMLFERSFLDYFGLPDRPLIRHVVHSPSVKDGYGGAGFPGLFDGLVEIGEDRERWEEVKRHTAAISHAVYRARASLNRSSSPHGA